ncbi:MAG: hypothetical protein KF799_11455 [Bdellovibrionales bacterium]|nr:hypothetical protein [Bdellovibrionales bacterium]
MRALSILFSVAILTLIATEVSAMPSRAPASEREPARTFTCKIVTGYGTAIGRGSSALSAKENARLTCGEKMIDQYIAQRGNIPQDVADDLALACVNLECQ